jgi:membrane protein DedA with SNARE-associated domain
MLNWIVAFALNHDTLIYLLIIVVAFFQGPLLAVTFGILLSFGYLHVLPIYAALMVGDLIGDTIWYHVGRAYGHKFIARWGRYVGVTDASVARMTRLFHHYRNAVLFISKITNGFGFAILTLVTAGMVGIPFGMYLFVNLLGQFIWTGVMLATGYYFSNAFIVVDNWNGRITLAVGLCILLFVLYRYWQYIKVKASNFDA